MEPPMNDYQWHASLSAQWAAMAARAEATEPAAPAAPKMPAGMRAHLLAILALGYQPGAAQTRLGNAPDAAIAWQVQSMLDDYADPAAGANDNFTGQAA